MTTSSELREMCNAEINAHEQCGGCDKSTIARALLSRLDAEEVTREQIMQLLFKTIPDNLFKTLKAWEDHCEQIADAILSLLAGKKP